MAKRAKIALIATHDMSATKKIFELNHGGKTRLTEISETVSCNCFFARGSDLCLHVIWILMNVLEVNKHGKMFHQKAHSAENVLKLFSNCKPNNVARLASTVASNIRHIHHCEAKRRQDQLACLLLVLQELQHVHHRQVQHRQDRLVCLLQRGLHHVHP